MRTPRKQMLVIGALAISAASGYALWKTSTAGPDANRARKVVCYQDSMHPWIKSDKPGKCTVCAMDLTPIYEGAAGFEVGENMIVLNSNHITVLNVQTEEVKRQPLQRTVRVAGTLEASETSKRVISAGKAGRIEHLAVPYVGFEVQAGQCLADFFIPELLAEARRYILLAQSDMRPGPARPTDLSNPLLSALQNLRLYGLSDGQIEELARSGKAEGSYQMLSPMAGTVIERNVSEGQYVSEGTRLFTIVDLSVLWFRFDAYEQDLPWLQTGQTVELTVRSAPGQVFSGPITFIEPFLNEATRIAKVRVDVTNPVVEINGVKQRALRHQLYAEGRVRAQTSPRLVVPSTAVLSPGGHSFAYVDTGDGAYEMRPLKLGRRGDEHWEVLAGLDAGDHVVTTGNVLIDAQAQFNRGTSGMETVDSELAAQPAMSAAGSDLPSASAPAAHSQGSGLSKSQQKALTEFLEAADGVSQALAADSLDRLKPHLAKLPALALALEKELGAGHTWESVLKRARAAVPGVQPGDLAAAREAFLPFSTNVVELVQQVRAQEESFQSLKVYYCSMAPKPGLWFQAQGPLRNPYYGSEMLTCGREVKAREFAAKAPPNPPATPLAEGTSAPDHASPPATPAPPPKRSAAPLVTAPRVVASLPPARAPNRVASFSELQPINPRDHSVYEDRMNNALAARFATSRETITNTVRPLMAPHSPVSGTPRGTEAGPKPDAHPHSH